ncbi:MAG: glycosyl hydrolase, partial [Acidobacteriota bacterium]
ISPDLTTSNPEHQDFAGGPISHDGTGVEVYGTVFAFEESPLEPGVLWAGSDDGRLHISRDAGGSWTEITPAGFPAEATINAIDLSAHDPGRAFIAAYRYREADFRPYIFRTNDYGQSWQLLTDGTNGIPQDHFVRVVREDPDRKGLLYAGTEFGIYVSFDNGAHWQSLQLNLPVTPVTDIQVHHKDLVLATQGRSFWILDDITPLHQITDQTVAASIHLYQPRRAFRVASGGFGSPGGRQAENPPNGAILYYSLSAKVDSVKLEITDANGESVRTFSSDQSSAPDLGPLAALASIFGLDFSGSQLSKEAGMHRFVWDLRYPAPTMPKDVLIFGFVQGPVAPPGTYQVKLTVGDASDTRTLDVQPDPRVSISQAQFDEQRDFLLRVGEALSDIAAKIDTLRSVREQVQQVAERVADAGLEDATVQEISVAAEAMVQKLNSIEEELAQTKSKSLEDPLNYPGKLTAQIANVQSVVNGGFGSVDAPPTDGARQRFEDLEAELAAVLARLQETLDTDLAAFNELVRSNNVQAVIVKGSSGQ